jgi:Porin subfamily
MGAVKRVLLGSAAGVFAVAGAQAADLEVKAKPVEYVKVCSLYGAGFWYVPGTDTCIKIGAFVKLQTQYNLASGGPFMQGVARNGGGDNGGRRDRTDTSEFTFNNRSAVSFDMRTQTEYGTLRSYFDAFFQTTGSDNAPTQLGSITLGNTRGFIQFAGFTAGRMRSYFDMYFQGAYGFGSGSFGNDTSPNGIVGAAYTWSFGGGVSASLSLEDNGQGNSGRGRSTVNLSQASLGIASNTFDNKGQEFFDPVFNLRLDQAWGYVGVSAALHDASGGYYQPGLNGVSSLSEGNGHPSDKFGYAATAAFLVNSPFGLQGDTVAGQGVWSKGAAGYAAVTWGPTALFGSGMRVGLGWMDEAVFSTGSNVELTTVWSFNAMYEHRWNPQWRTSLYGGVLGVQYDDAAKQMMCAKDATGKFVAFSGFSPNHCDPNWGLAQVGSRTMWNPVPDLDVGLDLAWTRLNTAFAGTAVLGQNGAKPAGTYTVSDRDALSAVFRIQRNFLY